MDKLGSLVDFSGKLVKGLLKKFLNKSLNRGIIDENQFNQLCKEIDEHDIYDLSED